MNRTEIIEKIADEILCATGADDFPHVSGTIVDLIADEALDAVNDESIGRCTDGEKEYLDDILKAIKERLK